MPLGDIWQHLETYLVVTSVCLCVGGWVSGAWYWRLVDGGQRMRLSVLQCLGQPHLQGATEVEKPCLRGREGILDFLVAITHAQR